MTVSESAGVMNLEELDKTMSDELGDLLHVENMLVKALPKLIAAVHSDRLKQLFERHLAETRGQVKRVEKMFATLDRPAREKKCEGMMGLLVECQHLVTRSKPSLAGDQALICAGRKIESCEIVAYGSVAAWAGLCGYSMVRELALEAIQEEQAMREALDALVVRDPVLPGRSSGKARARTLEVVS